jgi:hypothetical protein
MNVIPFKPPRSRRRVGPPVVPPALLSGAIPPSSRAVSADDDEDRLRMRQNLAAMAAIVTIVVLGAWLIDSLRHYSRIQVCIEAGHRNCIPIEAKFQPSPYRG